MGCDSFNSKGLKPEKIEFLAVSLKEAWENGNQVLLCGNGGSAGNAIHIANDLIYGAGACGQSPKVPGLNVEALTANSAVLYCTVQHSYHIYQTESN